MLEGITWHQPKVKKKQRRKCLLLSARPPEHGFFSLPTENFAFYFLFLFISPVRKEMYNIIKSQTQQKLIKQW